MTAREVVFFFLDISHFLAKVLSNCSSAAKSLCVMKAPVCTFFLGVFLHLTQHFGCFCSDFFFLTTACRRRQFSKHLRTGSAVKCFDNLLPGCVSWQSGVPENAMTSWLCPCTSCFRSNSRVRVGGVCFRACLHHCHLVCLYSLLCRSEDV